MGGVPGGASQTSSRSRSRHFSALSSACTISPTLSKFVAAIGIRNLVVVETPDALLICPRDRAQDVGKIVKWFEEQKRKDLL